MIAVDAMGGDFAPRAVVHGAYKAAQLGIPVQLFGDSKQLDSLLLALDVQWSRLPIKLIHCSQTISMGEEPSRAVLKKKDASLVRAIQAVVDGSAKAVVSAGHSGAALVAGTLIMGRTKGVSRPAIGEFLPTRTGSVFCMDLGANTDCKPEHLYQFAHMGHVYVSLIKNIATPRIALLSNGSEPYKGSFSVKTAYDLLMGSGLNFIGNVEARDVFDDQADVLVCDGFVGNVMLKAMQGMARVFSGWLSEQAGKSWWGMLRLTLAAGLFKSVVKEKLRYEKRGGALLLGVQYPLIVAHGCSDDEAMLNAIKYAHDCVQKRIVALFNRSLEQMMHAKPGLAQSVSTTIKSVLQRVHPSAPE